MRPMRKGDTNHSLDLRESMKLCGNDAREQSQLHFLRERSPESRRLGDPALIPQEI